MAQLKSTVVQGSLRVTDTTYTTDLVVSDVTTPTIANNDYLLVADASDGNKLLKGPIFDGSTTTQALTKKGTWATFGTSNLTIGTTAQTAMAGNTTVTNVAFTAATDNAEYPILLKNSTGSTTTAASAKFANTSNKMTTINPSTGTITAPAFKGALTGNVTGNVSGTAANVTGTVAVANGGTGQTSWTQWGVLYASASTTLTNTAAGTAGYLLQGNGAAAPSWIQATNSNTASTIVKRDSSGNFSAGTITANLTGNVTGNVSGSSGSCTGNAATATKWANAQTVYVALGTASKTTTIQGGNSNAVELGIDGTLAIGHGGTGITTTDAHEVLIGPSSGNAAAPTWRTIAAADLPTAATNALGIMKVGTGLGVSSGTVSVSYGTNANTALQGNAYLVKLNGLTKTAASDSMADFYAPTSVGTNGQFLKSVGSGEPAWSDLPTASTTVAGIVTLGASGGAATYEHTHAANAVIKSTDISWSNVATYTYSDPWITAGTAIVATDLQYKKPAAIIEWVVSAGKIVFTCSAACTISFSIMMLKQA